MGRCPPCERRAQFAQRCSEDSSPSEAFAVNAAATASAAAVHITCRYASTTVTDARAVADVCRTRIRAKRPRRGRQAARPHCSPIPTRQLLPGHCLRERLALRAPASRTSRQWAVHQSRQCRRQRPCRALADGLPEPPGSQALRARGIERVEGRRRSGGASRRLATKPRSSARSCSGLNCPQHFTRRFTEPELEQVFEPDR